MSIRGKLAAIILLAAIVPLLIGVVAIWRLGLNYYVSERGQLFQSSSQHVAETMRGGIEAEVRLLRDWVDLSNLSDDVDALVSATAGRNEDLSGQEFIDAMLSFDREIWPSLGAGQEPLKSILTNHVTDRIRQFQQAHPNVVEVLVTDDRGRIIAASGKSSDFYLSLIHI